MQQSDKTRKQTNKLKTPPAELNLHIHFHVLDPTTCAQPVCAHLHSQLPTTTTNAADTPDDTHQVLPQRLIVRHDIIQLPPHGRKDPPEQLIRARSFAAGRAAALCDVGCEGVGGVGFGDVAGEVSEDEGRG